MKKVFISLLLLFVSQGIFAQLDWSQLSDAYSKMFVLAERVAEQTDKIIADDNGVAIVGETGATTFERGIDLQAAKEHFKYKLVKADGSKIPLDKVLTEKVIKKYSDILKRVEESLKVDRGGEVEEILNSLFN